MQSVGVSELKQFQQYLSSRKYPLENRLYGQFIKERLGDDRYIELSLEWFNRSI